ncbi:MAG: DUF1223 domain-containing protein [Kiloniellaceae bacterium]|nr:DUF1223 domain-containing protein [Kiloniellaceae bacterium]
MSLKTSTLGALGALALVAGLGFWTAQSTPESLAASAGRDENPAPLQLAAGPGEGRPVVVELFTSQGCSSCPPADALLDELAHRPGVLALSFHVDYWDYIGWKDPFASAQYTERQRDYAAKLGLRYVYTPQMVVDGRYDAVGSNRREVTRAIQQSAETPSLMEVTLDATDGGRALLSAGEAPSGGATVWLVTFDDGHDTPVARGENRGRDLHNSNVVREMRALGTWTGEAKVFPLDLQAARAEGRGGCAIIVQQGRGGPVLGAAVFDLDGPPG